MLRDFPLDQIALKAAVIAHCAGPERQPQFVEVFFAQQASWARADDPVQALKQLAQLGGLGADQIDACLADKALEDAVLQARLDGQQKFDISLDADLHHRRQDLRRATRASSKFAELIDPLLGQ